MHFQCLSTAKLSTCVSVIVMCCKNSPPPITCRNLLQLAQQGKKEGGCTEKARESSYRHMSMNKDCQSLVLLMRPPPPGGGVFVVFFFNSWTLLLKMKSLLRRRPSAGVGDSTISVIGAVKLYNVWCYRITCR